MDEESDGEAAILAIGQVGDNLRALSALLKPLGRRVLAARSNAEALELASRERIAVLLVDVVGRDTDAVGTVAALRALSSRSTPAILLTKSHPALGEINPIQQAGLVDYIIKPIPARLLRNKVAAFVSLERQE